MQTWACVGCVRWGSWNLSSGDFFSTEKKKLSVRANFSIDQVHHQLCDHPHPTCEPHFQAGERYRPPRRSCHKISEIFPRRRKVLEMCPRAAQTSPIDRVWNVGTIYDGSMMRWTDRVAIGAENDRSTSGEPAEQM